MMIPYTKSLLRQKITRTHKDNARKQQIPPTGILIGQDGMASSCTRGGLDCILEETGTWFSGGLGRARLMVGLDLTGLLQPKQFHDSVMMGTISTLYTETSWELEYIWPTRIEFWTNTQSPFDLSSRASIRNSKAAFTPCLINHPKVTRTPSSGLIFQLFLKSSNFYREFVFIQLLVFSYKLISLSPPCIYTCMDQDLNTWKYKQT